MQDEGFVVATAANGREALERLRSGLCPAAIVLDLMMPVMDGWQFRQEQLDDPDLRKIPVVVVSAMGFRLDEVRAQLGDVELVAKPVHWGRLLEALRPICRSASSAA